jgi:hypothetical protein
MLQVGGYKQPERQNNTKNYDVMVPGVAVCVIDERIEYIQHGRNEAQNRAGSCGRPENMPVYADDAQHNENIAHAGYDSAREQIVSGVKQLK